MSFLKLSDVGKQYKTGSVTVDALSGVSAEFNDGEFVVVLGLPSTGATTWGLFSSSII